MSDTVNHGLLQRILDLFTCPFCQGKGEIDLGEKDGKSVVSSCSPCVGIGLMHPARVARIKARFGIKEKTNANA